MTVDQIDDEVLKLKKEQFNLRFQRATGQLENTTRVREVRRESPASRPSCGRSAAPQELRRTERCPSACLQGVVVSDKQDKTVVVRVERRFTHPLFKKTVRRSKKYYAHDEKNEFKIGDIVWIEEHRPISKLKSWAVVARREEAGVVMARRERIGENEGSP